MIYLINYLLILGIKVKNRLGRGFYFKRKLFSSKEILEKNFSRKKTFNFIQVGANDGISFDFLYDFIVQRNSEGIVLEPVKEYFAELMQNYKDFPKIIKINKAIHLSKKRVVINRISPNVIGKYPDWVKGIASLNSEHHKKTGIESNDIIEEEVKADTLMNIVSQYLLNKKLDYFQVDTEGYDYEIIKMIDFNIIRPTIIKYEFVNLSIEDQIDSKLLLEKQGYYIFLELGDCVGVDLKKIKLF